MRAKGEKPVMKKKHRVIWTILIVICAAVFWSAAACFCITDWNTIKSKVKINR